MGWSAQVKVHYIKILNNKSSPQITLLMYQYLGENKPSISTKLGTSGTILETKPISPKQRGYLYTIKEYCTSCVTKGVVFHPLRSSLGNLSCQTQ
ncbi:hypothetical protein VNO80_19803 [Phaseolus coccineus]|uniref:Uncharacterized protein n=1 Tax=Phaseolus coccineus TaxID=3886 RepID=A0AAN9MLM2_PHACN